MGRILVEKDVEAAVKGGSVYAAGGGGWADHGRMLGRAAVNAGKPELVSIDELKDGDWVATAAAIGAPASTNAMGDARRRLRQGGAASSRSTGGAARRADDRTEWPLLDAQRLVALSN